MRSRPFIYGGILCGLVLLSFWDKTLATVLAGLVILRLAAVRVVPARWTARILSDSGAPSASELPAAGRAGLRWLGAALGVVIVAVLVLECAQPCFFTQQDVYCGSLPVIVQASRSLLVGVFPRWNPCQFLGAPTANLGIHTLTYPPTYLAYAIARFLLGHEYWTFEVLAFLHLFVGVFATYWAARAWRIGPPLASAATVAYVLSGYMLIVGRCWINFIPSLVWVPVLFGALARLKDGPVTWRWSVGVGLVIALLYHAGFAQLWVYAVGFFLFALAVLVAGAAIPVRRSLWVIPAVLGGLALTAPVLYAQMQFSSDVIREHMPQGIPPAGLLAMLLPYPILGAKFGWEYRMADFTQLYYSGTLFCVAGGLALLALLCSRWSKALWAENVWLLCAFGALCMAFGDVGRLWPLLGKLPWFEKFRYAERALPFWILAVTLGGGIVTQRLLNVVRNRRAWEAGLSAAVLAVMLYHAVNIRAAYWLYEEPPYPELPAELAGQIRPPEPGKPQRAASLAPKNEIPLCLSTKGYATSLEQNFATVYGVLSLDGYDPLLFDHAFFQRYVVERIGRHSSAVEDVEAAMAAEDANRLAVCHAYGVRWLTAFDPGAPGKPFRTDVQPLPDACPLAFAERDPVRGFPISFTCRGATVDVSGLVPGGPFIVNILAWPQFKVYADGKRIAYEPDAWGRLRVLVPRGARVLEAIYSPPFGAGALIGLVLAAGSVACVMGLASARDGAKTKHRIK